MSAASVLIVEDEAVIARDLEGLLLDQGYQVPAIAATADEAMQAVVVFQPDLVLLDIRLGEGGSGLDVAERLRKCWDTPVIFLTAHADADTVARAERASPYSYLLKPFNEREIAVAVRLALAKSASDRRLSASERLFATTLRSVTEGVIVTDSNQSITFLNPRAEHLTGWTEAEALGRPLREVYIVQHGLASHEGRAATSIVLLARGDQRYELDEAVAPLTDEQGRVSGAVVVFRDVTEQRRAAEQQRRLAQALQESQRRESLSRLAGGIANDFNNILMSVRGYVEIAEDISQTKREVQQACMHALLGIRRAVSLTTQLLAYSGQGRAATRPVALNEQVREIAMLLRGTIVSRSTLELDLDPALPPVLADDSQIRQMVLNLLTNAVEAVEPKGGTVTVQTRQEHLGQEQTDRLSGATALQAGRYVCLAVRDNGQGMSRATQAKMFDPFFTTKETGHGLGLAAVQGIVRGHAGAIHVTSSPGAGTTIQVYLPITLAEVSAPAPLPPAPAAALPTHKALLVIDDDPDVRSITVRLLEYMNCVVHTAANGAEALALLMARTPHIDAVITDLIMPGICGPALVQAIQQARPGLPIIVMSGYHAEEFVAQHQESGVRAFLKKPFTRADLAAALILLDT